MQLSQPHSPEVRRPERLHRQGKIRRLGGRLTLDPVRRDIERIAPRSNTHRVDDLQDDALLDAVGASGQRRGGERELDGRVMRGL